MSTTPLIGAAIGKRAEFEMSESQLQRLLDSGKPTPAMWGSGGTPLFSAPQENANNAWRTLANELGFEWDTVAPVPGKGTRVFSAVAKAAAAPSQAQPCPCCKGKGYVRHEDGTRRECFCPPPAQDGQQAPSGASVPAVPSLTDEQLDKIIDEQWGKGCVPSQYMAHRAFARAVLRAAMPAPTPGETKL